MLCQDVGLLLGFFGFNYFLWILSVSSVIFIVIKKLLKGKKKLIPYGPFIVLSTWVCLLFEDFFETIYMNVMTYLCG